MPIAALSTRAIVYVWTQVIVSRAMSVVIAISEKRISATRANTTAGLANRVARMPPSKAIPVSSTPSVAKVAPGAWRSVRVSPRKITDSTTVRPPNAATIPLTTAIGPTGAP